VSLRENLAVEFKPEKAAAAFADEGAANVIKGRRTRREPARG
jgi:hypothetical protein